jgi:DNA-binding XRE family transcriptional regulator/mannose-6-phosphate isomerase-like protein (cupin superfamily)
MTMRSRKINPSPPKSLAEKLTWDRDLLIGAHIKHARRNRRLSLRQLADIVGCTESFLSKVENDKVRPSLTMLHKIVVALGISVAKLFAEERVDNSPVTVLPAEGRLTLMTGQLRNGKGISLESLLPVSSTMLLEANIHHVAPGGSSRGFIKHQGEEMGFVLEGELELSVAKKTFNVKKGDSFFFLSHLPHGYRNPGSITAKILWVNTPQSF